MQSLYRGQQDDRFDGDAAVGRLLALGAGLGTPATFVVCVIMFLVAGAHWPGVLAIAAWAALVGGTFCGVALVLARRLAEVDARARGAITIIGSGPAAPADDAEQAAELEMAASR